MNILLIEDDKDLCRALSCRLGQDGHRTRENLIHVRDFLGHTDIKTTGIYARSSLAMKKRALEMVSDTPVAEVPSWQENKDMLLWLKSFGAHHT